MVSYKQKCVKCKNAWVVVGWKNRFPVCYECHEEQMKGEIKDPKLKKMFDLPEEMYRKSVFLRNIKISYLKFGKLTEKQIEAFKKTVDKIKEKEAEKAEKG